MLFIASILIIFSLALFYSLYDPTRKKLSNLLLKISGALFSISLVIIGLSFILITEIKTKSYDLCMTLNEENDDYYYIIMGSDKKNNSTFKFSYIEDNEIKTIEVKSSSVKIINTEDEFDCKVEIEYNPFNPWFLFSPTRYKIHVPENNSFCQIENE